LQRNGFRKTILDAGMEYTQCAVSAFQSSDRVKWQHFQEQIGEWIHSWSRPIAIHTHTDLLARYLAEACHARNLKVPGDVALVGSQNEPLICLNPEPTLSSIDLGFERIGYQAAQLLDQLMEGEPAPEAPILMPPAELILRQSSNAFATKDPLVTSALAFIADHAHTSISVDDIAAAVSTTRRTLARRFQSSLGKSVHYTLTQLRLDRIKRELLDTDDTLETVAIRCGLRDTIHLCRVFQREEGISPTDFREMRQPNFIDQQINP
jgi:LacI family transcriptional regulator